MPPDNNVEPTTPKCHLRVMVEGGNEFVVNSPLSKDECIKLIVEDGGSSRTGYAIIKNMAKPGMLSEHVYIFRQKILGFLIVDIGEIPKKGLIVVPKIEIPNDVITKKE